MKKQLIIDYKLTFTSERGKRVLADLRRRCPFLDSAIPVTAKEVDVDMMLVNEGARGILLYIYRMLRTDPEAEVQTHARTESK